MDKLLDRLVTKKALINESFVMVFLFLFAYILFFHHAAILTIILLIFNFIISLNYVCMITLIIWGMSILSLIPYFIRTIYVIFSDRVTSHSHMDKLLGINALYMILLLTIQVLFVLSNFIHLLISAGGFLLIGISVFVPGYVLYVFLTFLNISLIFGFYKIKSFCYGI